MKSVRAGFEPGANSLLAGVWIGIAGFLWSPMGGAQVSITVGLPAIELRAEVAPPILPVYAQPPVPAPGYIWTPGYWSYGEQGYYWVPGTWVEPPSVGLLWTPGYWGWDSGVYVFNQGYWGPHVGFYGGVNYGHGYGGVGFAGGRWSGDHFEYNSSVTNVHNTSIHNTYNERVVNNTTVTRVSFNGGPRGLRAAASPTELSAARESHAAPTENQLQHSKQASQNESLRAAVNHGRPAVAATPRPGVFSGPGIVAARPAVQPVAHRTAATASPTPVAERPAPVNRPVQAAPRPEPEHTDVAAHAPAGPPHGSEPHPAEHTEARPHAAPGDEHGERR